MGRFLKGQWLTEREWASADGSFKRSPTTYRAIIEPADVAAGRYHLYVSYACPWAHRTLILRALRGLAKAIGVSVVHPHMDELGWSFEEGEGVVPDPVLGARRLSELYVASDAEYTGRVTVPVLWDRETGGIVNNESRDIIRMMDTVFEPLASGPRFYSEALGPAIDAMIDGNYERVNNGVYKAGFARSQAAYEAAVTTLFDRLDALESLLEGQPWLCGAQITEADWCLFTTLLRMEPVYHTHFKCNLRRLRDYPELWSHTRALYQVPGVAETVHMQHIKSHYFGSHRSLNPSGVVPLGPLFDLEAPAQRGS